MTLLRGHKTATDCSAMLLHDDEVPSLLSATLLRGHKTPSTRFADILYESNYIKIQKV